MAELRGVPIDVNWYFSGMHIVPSFRDGFYEDFFLSKNSSEDKAEYTERPTGPNGSGPYFHAILSGRDGVTGVAEIGGRRYVTHMDFRHKGEGITETYNGNCKYRMAAHYYCDGQTFVGYYLVAYEKEPPSAWVGSTCHFYCRTVAHLNSIGYRIPARKIYLSNRITPSYAAFDFQVGLLDTYFWFALTGAKDAKYLAPDLSYLDSMWYTSYANEIPSHDGIFRYPNGEKEAFDWWRISGSLPGVYRNLAGQAYYNGAQNLPKSMVNSVASVLEAAESVAALAKGDFSSLLPSDVKSAWLQYRYQYTTTKADIGEYADLTERLVQLAAMPEIRSDGSARSGGISCHCRFSIDPTQMIPSNTKRWLNTYGFRLSALNIWDMIPYSFVVDWFLNVGPFLEVCEEENWAYSLDVFDDWTSFSTLQPHQSTYFRVPGHFRAKCPFLDYTSRGPSGKTIVKRVLDSIALFS